ncbi:hypothetical protein CsatA_005916 [Cannabis sativa]
MEFWGVEIKAGEPLKIEPDDDMVIHLSQAVLGETKSKGSETVYLNVKVGDQKFVLANLSLDKFPQVTFDLVFDQEVELSHNWKNGSIHLCGYQAPTGPYEGDEMEEGQFMTDSSDEEEEVPVTAVENGKGAIKPAAAKAAAGKRVAAPAKPEASGKAKVKVVEPSKDDEEDDSDDSDSDDSDEIDSEGDSDEDMLDGDDSDDSDSDEEDDEETPVKPEVSKKRPAASPSKTPVSSKKSKAAASPKSDGKKVAHVSTPHPSKKSAAKTPATPATDKSKQTPKSAGNVSCKTCSKSFNSDKALESHTKAKHA